MHMAFPIEEKLVIAIASSAVLTLDAARDAFREKGLAAYRQYQREHQQDIMERGPAFTFVRRLLNFNKLFPEIQPVEVVLLSHNDADTGLRIMNSLKHYELDVTRAAFITDEKPHHYLAAYNSSLFLSRNRRDVEDAIAAGFAAGTVLESALNDDPDDESLRVAFDFDGVIADGTCESVFKGKVLTDSIRWKRKKPLFHIRRDRWRNCSGNWQICVILNLNGKQKSRITSAVFPCPS